MSQGFQSQLGIDTQSTVRYGFEFDNCSMQKAGTIVDTTGLRGTRQHMDTRTRDGINTYRGTLSMQPSPEELTYLLPWILGANASGNNYATSETLQSRYLTIDKVTKVYTYSGVYVDTARFSCSSGSPMRLALDLVASGETVANAGNFPEVTYQNTASLMIFGTVLSILSSNRNIEDFELSISNALEVKYRQNQDPSQIMPTDRNVTLRLTSPFTSAEIDMVSNAGASNTDAGASLQLNYGAKVLTFTFGALQFPPRDPTVNGRTEILLPVEAIARRNLGGSVPDIGATLALS